MCFVWVFMMQGDGMHYVSIRLKGNNIKSYKYWSFLNWKKNVISNKLNKGKDLSLWNFVIYFVCLWFFLLGSQCVWFFIILSELLNNSFASTKHGTVNLNVVGQFGVASTGIFCVLYCLITLCGHYFKCVGIVFNWPVA